MQLKCMFGMHKWEYCKCSIFGKFRYYSHNWDGCKCTICGEIRNSSHESHEWDNGKCKKCLTVRTENWKICPECKKEFVPTYNEYWCISSTYCNECGSEVIGTCQYCGADITRSEMAHIRDTCNNCGIQISRSY
jgi:hypothetical protein